MAREATRIDVDTADDIVTFEDRVSEAPALLEILGVSHQILQVRFQRHGYRPVRLFLWTESGSRSDVVDARHPCSVVTVVVLLAQRFQVKLGPGVGAWDFEARRYERVFHEPRLGPGSCRT